MKLTEAQLIEKAKEYAQQNYENGMDMFVECYEEEEWAGLVHTPGGKLMTWDETKNVMDSVASVRRERQADADYHIRQAIGEPAKAAQVETAQLVKDNPQVESALRQAVKNSCGQPFLSDYDLNMTVEEARKHIHHLQHLND